MSFIRDLIVRLTSRKFIAAVGAFAVLVQQKRYPEAVGAISAFIVGEAGVDITRARQGAATVATDVQQAAASFESNLKD